MPALRNSLRQDRGYTESCLPRTMDLANENRDLIEPKLDPSTEKFPFQDRVLIWLAPYWLGDVEQFHSGDGNSMDSNHEEYKLSRFDEHYSKVLGLVIQAKKILTPSVVRARF